MASHAVGGSFVFALMFWQGGFTFYSSIVVPIGRHVLAEEVDLQSVITQRVTSWLNVAGVVALFLLAGTWPRPPLHRASAGRGWPSAPCWP